MEIPKMKFNERDDTYTLSTGRILSANLGILGIGPDAEDISDGYDGNADLCAEDGFWDTHEVWERPVLSAEERMEIAGEMISRWHKWGYR